MNNEKKFIKLTPFKMQVLQSFPFIDADFDAITNYELLCKVVEYLNTTVDNVDLLNDEVEEYINKFNTLKSYVDNYFDNLDVQEEINNKLDKMVEDGTLASIIYDYLNSTALFCYDTVSDMKLAKNLIDGSFTKTLGYNSIADGGAANYKIRKKTISDVIDEMYILSLYDNNLVAELIIDNTLYSKQCGIVGDGLTDETDKLNIFYSTKTDVNKVLNKGEYLISDTIFIKGEWRRDENRYIHFDFNNATIKWNGTSDGKSIIFYNMFKYKISGLSIARNSTANKVCFDGCWHIQCDSWDIGSLYITNESSLLLGKSYATLSNEYISFFTAYVKGQFIIKTESTYYTNCINFYNSIIDGSGYENVVEFYGAKAKEEINFFNTDLSYGSKAVFYIDEAQTSPASINCIGCYFDSAISIFRGEEKNGVEFNTLFGITPANSNNEVVNIKYKDFANNLSVGGYTPFGHNLPTTNVNYALNGNLTYQTSQSGQYNYLMGGNSAAWTKTYETSNLSPSGKCRRIVSANGNSNENKTIQIEAITAPRTNIYTAFVRLKVNAGTFDSIQIGFSGKYTTFSRTQVGSNEVLLMNSKQVTINANSSLNFGVTFTNASSDLNVDFYEVGVIEGKLVIPNLPLHSAAVLS